MFQTTNQKLPTVGNLLSHTMYFDTAKLTLPPVRNTSSSVALCSGCLVLLLKT